MSQIILKNEENNKLKYNVYVGKKKLKKNSDIILEKTNFIIIKQKTIYSNLAFIIFLWFIAFIRLICVLLSNAVNENNESLIKGYRNIRINYIQALKEEIFITIGKTFIQIEGMEVISIVINSIKCGETSLEQNEGIFKCQIPEIK